MNHSTKEHLTWIYQRLRVIHCENPFIDYMLKLKSIINDEGGDMEKYVCGFLFDKNMEHVLLIEKDHPEWQKGNFNGVGGKLQPHEIPQDAMTRELKEETGIDFVNWRMFSVLTDEEKYIVYFFTGMTDNIHQTQQIESEKPVVFTYDDLPNNILPNLNWLIPMAMDESIWKSKITTIQ